MFRYDALRFEAQKLRLVEAFTHPHDPAQKRAFADRLRRRDAEGLPPAERFALRVACRVSGYFHVLPAIRESFRGPRFEPDQPELYPRFREDEAGEIRLEPACAAKRCAGYPPPGDPGAAVSSPRCRRTR